MLTAVFRMANKLLKTHSNHFQTHVPFWCPFLHPRLTAHHSNRGVPLRWDSKWDSLTLLTGSMDMNSVQIWTNITASLGAGHLLNLFPLFCNNLRWDYVKASLNICLTLASCIVVSSCRDTSVWLCRRKWWPVFHRRKCQSGADRHHSSR